VKDIRDIFLIALGTILLTALTFGFVIAVADWGLTITGN
jgi:hypothetical protein|tara:strand:- start:174 stop:290 length:117 start_codon:yes stop_codon:yes gene_type:complete